MRYRETVGDGDALRPEGWALGDSTIFSQIYEVCDFLSDRDLGRVYEYCQRLQREAEKKGKKRSRIVEEIMRNLPKEEKE